MTLIQFSMTLMSFLGSVHEIMWLAGGGHLFSLKTILASLKVNHVIYTSVLETASGRWPNAPNVCLGLPKISKLWALVAQFYLSGNSK